MGFPVTFRKKICPGSPLLLLLLASCIGIQPATTEVTCGQRSLTHAGYIFKGYDAIEGDWPWHAGIFQKIMAGKQKYICGGTIISVNFVVTAAHCTVPNRNILRGEELSVRLGLHNRTNPSEHARTYEVLEIVRHEAFNINNLRNDIALLRLEQDIVYSDYIQPICLWPEDKRDLSSIISKRGTVVGWGLGDASKLAEILQQATLNVVDYDTCMKSRPQHFQRVLSEDQSNFCAGNKNMTNVCSGDSGGGLYFEMDSSWYIRGLVSAGARPKNEEQPCDPKQFVTFSDIPFYLKWILRHQEAVKKRNLLNLGSCGLETVDEFDDERKKPVFLQYPWTAMLEFEAPGSTANLNMCNGALIHPRFVLTAGHCVDDAASKYKLKSVRLGEYNLKTNPDKEKNAVGEELSTFIQSKAVEKVIKHPAFSQPRYDNNIALLKLINPADIGQPNVKPICLPALEDFNEMYTVSGWKRVGKQSHVIRRDVVTLEDMTYCHEIYAKMKIKLSTVGHHVCGTNYNEQNPYCFHFMGGAPLQYVKNVDRKNRYFLKGIFTYGYPSCQQNYTDVFTNINPYADWIKEIFVGEGFSI